MRNLIYSKLDSPFPNYKIKRPQNTFAFLKIGFCQIQLSIWETSHIQHRFHCFAALSTFVKNIFMLVFAFSLVPHVMVQEVSSKPPTQWCSLICLLQHFSGKWTICSPHNFLYLSQVCFLIVGSSLHAACVIEHSFLSLTFLLQNLLCWPFFSGKYENCF